jgi:CheY-like chemotaxis protein
MSAPTAKGRKPRVLIADDNPQGVELLEAYLADTDWDVRTVADGEEALRAVREWRPDVVLLDVMMPRISGFEVCKQIRANPETRRTAVLMVTALDQPADIDKAVDAGTNDFLTKPINKTDLLVRVRAALAALGGEGPLDETLLYIEGVEKARP